MGPVHSPERLGAGGELPAPARADPDRPPSRSYASFKALNTASAVDDAQVGLRACGGGSGAAVGGRGGAPARARFAPVSGGGGARPLDPPTPASAPSPPSRAGRPTETDPEMRPAHPKTQWLTFWIVSAVFTTIETVLMLVKWVPLYFELKLLALAWLVAPQTKGATLVYERAIAPALKKHASKLDPVFAGADRALKSKQVAQVAALVEKYGPVAAQKVIDEASHRAADLVKPQ